MDFLLKLKEDLNSLPPERKEAVQKIFSSLAENLQKNEIIDDKSLSIFNSPIEAIDSQRHLGLLQNQETLHCADKTENKFFNYGSYSEAEEDYKKNKISLFHLYMNFREEKRRLNNGFSKQHGYTHGVKFFIFSLLSLASFFSVSYLLTHKILIVLGALLMGVGTGFFILTWLEFYRFLKKINNNNLNLYKNSFLTFFDYTDPIDNPSSGYKHEFYIPDLPINDSKEMRNWVKKLYTYSETKAFIEFKLKKNEAITIDELLFLNHYGKKL